MAYPTTPKFDIVKVWEHFSGEELPPGRARLKVCCVIHEETRPSATIDTVKNSFRCFACDIGGDALDLIQAKEGCGFAESVTRAEAITGTTGQSVSEGTDDRAGRGRPVGLFGSSGNKRAVNRRVPARRGAPPRGM